MAVDISGLSTNKINNSPTSQGKATAEEWNALVAATKENQKAVFKVKMDGVVHTPNSEGVVELVTSSSDTQYFAKLTFERDTDLPIVTVNDNCKVRLFFSSIRSSDGQRSNANYEGTLYIRRQVTGGKRETVGSMPLDSRSEGSTTFDEINLGQYLVDGKQTINLAATFQPMDSDGNAIGTPVTSNDYNIVFTKTSLYVEYAETDIAQPWSTSGKEVHVAFRMTGEIDRTLHVMLKGSTGTPFIKEYPISSSQYTNTLGSPFETTISLNPDTAGILTHGVKTIEAWLTCSDGTTADAIESDHCTAQRMVVTDSSDNEPHLLIQNLKRKIVNYVALTEDDPLFSYVLYSKTTDTKDITFRLSDYAGTTEYFRLEQTVTPNMVYKVPTTVEIENATDDNVYAYFHAFDANGEAMTTRETITVDNTEKFAPTLGADFLLNPKTRNNSEKSPNTIINAMTGKTLSGCSFSGFGGVSDRWLQAEDGQRVLRILAGQSVTIGYDWLLPFKTNNAANVTLEFDYKVANVTDEDTPIIKASETYGSNFIGFQMKPLEGIVYTKSKRAYQEQNFMLQEEERTHISINIVSALRATADTSAKALALCRVFINGVINREFIFDTASKDWYESGSKIIIGQQHADIDIYSIRCYTKELAASQVLTNYTATLPTAEQKLAFRKSNDILNGATNLIDLGKCRENKKNVLIWHGIQPRFHNQAGQNGWWEINIYDDSGNEDKEHSGTICKETAALTATRQGTTANTYYYSNLQTKLKDVKATIKVAVENIHSDITIGDVYTASATDEEKGEVQGKQYVKIYGCGLGKNDWANKEDTRSKGAQTYLYENGIVTVPDGWIDGNGKYRGKAYKMADDTNYGIKLVNKINYASAMQSHLMGANNAYNDLHMAIVGKIGMQRDNSKARICKRQMPFLFFTQTSDNSRAEYQGPCTFGAGKMDDASFGYDKKQYPHFCMLEGADNNLTLTDFRTPWESRYIGYKQKDGEAESYTYNGAVSLDLDKYVNAKTTNDKGEKVDAVVDVNGVATTFPSDYIEDKIKEFVNFIYLHSTRIKVYLGTWAQFLNSDSAKETTYKWWCTSGTDAYKLRRYDEVAKSWVEAGWNDSTEQNVILRLSDSYPDVVTANAGNWEDMNADFIRAIAAHAKANLDDIIVADSLRFHYNFVNQFLAGTDNCSKNTYYILVPCEDGEYRWAFAQDDMDTIFATDNSGYQNKPYYVDRVHPESDVDNTSVYQGMANALFDLCHDMWEESGENMSMMKEIFSNMVKLCKGNKKSPWGFLKEYFFAIQEWIPAVAYNEAARIRYEYPTAESFVTSRNIRPITQSCGDQMQAELQFMKRRLVYFASYAAWGNFNAFDAKDGDLGIEDAADNFGIQGTMGDPEHAIILKNFIPHQYLYPTGFVGGTSKSFGKRCKPNVAQTWDLTGSTLAGGDTSCGLCGANYYRSFGNIGDLYINSATTFTLKGKRLQDVTINPTSEDNHFNPPQMELKTPYIEKLTIKGGTNISGNLDLSSCVRLRTIDTRDSGVENVTLPQGRLLTTVHLGSKQRELSLVNMPVLTTFDAQGYSNVRSVEISNCPRLNTLSIVSALQTANKPSATKAITISNVNWSGVSVGTMEWLVKKQASLTGKITMAKPADDENKYITFADKIAMGKLWGNIDSTKNALYISYTKKHVSRISIDGDINPYKANNNYQYSLVATPEDGNDVKLNDNGTAKVKWTLADTAATYATINASSGLLHVTKTAPTETKHELSVVLSLDDYDINASRNLKFKRHIPVVGEFAYSDGVFSDEYFDDKDVVGLVFMREDVTNGSGSVTGYDVHVVAYDFLDLNAYSHPYFTANGDANSKLPASVKTEIETLIGESVWPSLTIRAKKIEGSVPNLLDKIRKDGAWLTLEKETAESDFDGKGNTDIIAQKAITILTRGLGYTEPKDYDGFKKIFDDIVAADGLRYATLIYPTYLGAHLYQPTVDSKLADVYKSGKWYIPADGEFLRLVVLVYNSYSYGGNNTYRDADLEAAEADLPIFANAKAKGLTSKEYDPKNRQMSPSSTKNGELPAAYYYGTPIISVYRSFDMYTYGDYQEMKHKATLCAKVRVTL